jgi:hypothetical protein
MTLSSHRQASPGNADLVITCVLGVIFAGGFLLALQWGFRASLVPSLACGLGVVLSLAHLAVLLVRRTKADGGDPVPHEQAHEEAEADLPQDAEYVFATAGAAAWRSNLAWLAGFFVVLYIAGLIPAAVLFTAAYLKKGAGASWPLALGYAVVLGLLLWLVFVLLLAIPMPEGLFS